MCAAPHRRSGTPRRPAPQARAPNLRSQTQDQRATNIFQGLSVRGEGPSTGEPRGLARRLHSPWGSSTTTPPRKGRIACPNDRLRETTIRGRPTARCAREVDTSFGDLSWARMQRASGRALKKGESTQAKGVFTHRSFTAAHMDGTNKKSMDAHRVEGSARFLRRDLTMDGD